MPGLSKVAIVGDGVILRDSTANPPKVRAKLAKIGNEPVQSLELVRTPLASSTKFLLNLASGGQLDAKLKELNIDKLFHLNLLINGKYILEKNEVISLKDGNPVKQDSETLQVPVGGQLTIGEMLAKTQQQMGSNYGSYDAVNNNCGVFVGTVLNANGLGNDQTQKFTSQKTEELFSHFPQFTKFLTDAVTTAGAVADRAIQGEGVMGGMEEEKGAEETKGDDFVPYEEKKPEMPTLHTSPLAVHEEGRHDEFYKKARLFNETFHNPKDRAKEKVKKLRLANQARYAELEKRYGGIVGYLTLKKAGGNKEKARSALFVPYEDEIHSHYASIDPEFANHLHNYKHILPFQTIRKRDTLENLRGYIEKKFKK